MENLESASLDFPNEVLQKSKKKKGKITSAKLPVDKLLEKTMISDKFQYSTFVPEERIKTVSKPSRPRKSHSPTGRDEISTLNSYGSKSITSRNTNGIGNLSCRSYAIEQMGPNGELFRADRTTREMIFEIESRVKRNLPPPVYVPNYDELGADAFSWNSRVLRKSASGKTAPAVNIIGCHHPIELILARADQRSRKIQQTAAVMMKVCADRRDHVDAMIQAKFSRAEKHAALVLLQQRQVVWMKLIKLGCYFNRLIPYFRAGVQLHHMGEKKKAKARIIFRAIRRWHARLLDYKYNVLFLKRIEKHKWSINMRIRIMRKTIAIKKIKFALELKKGQGQQKMTNVVHNFIACVKTIQRVGRDFIACKRARVIVLAMLWDRFEPRYVKKRLKERNEAKPVDKHKLATLDIDPKLRSEMEKQTSRWESIDSKMEESIIRHRLDGNLKQQSSHDAVVKLLLPKELKEGVLAKFLATKRKEHLLKHQEVHLMKSLHKTSFTPEDVYDLMRGHATTVDQLVKAKLGATVVRKQHEPFLMFRWITHRMVFQKAIETHEAAETFVIHIGNSESRAANKFLRLKQLEATFH